MSGCRSPSSPTSPGGVGAPDIAGYHNNLGFALHELGAATADAAAEAEAVSCQRAALAAAGPDDPDRAGYLCSLSSGLRALFRYTGQAGLLQEAARAAAEAVGRPALEPSLATRHAVLAGSLADLYEHRADPAVLAGIITAYREAASWAEFLDEPGLAAHWNSLGGWLSERYERTGDVGALSEGISSAARRWPPPAATSTCASCRSWATRCGCGSSGPATWPRSPRPSPLTAGRWPAPGPATRTCRAAPATSRAR
jgi:hypothetical protein